MKKCNYKMTIELYCRVMLTVHVKVDFTLNPVIGLHTASVNSGFITGSSSLESIM